jgi:hypothetical protein
LERATSNKREERKALAAVATSTSLGLLAEYRDLLNPRYGSTNIDSSELKSTQNNTIEAKQQLTIQCNKNGN